MKISIETLKKIIAESKNDLTLEELLVRANVEEEIEPDEYDVLCAWAGTLVNEVLDAVLMRSEFCAEKGEGSGMKTHELKILPEYFDAVISGRKRFEIRKNDRDYKVGDQLILKEWSQDDYTGDSYKAKITYITDYMQRDGYVVLGILGLEKAK